MKGLVQNNPANDPDKKPFKSRSRFKPNVSVFQTARFGEATPFYAAEVVPDDQNFSLRVNSDLDTMTLRSPLMSPVRMNKDYFFAPLRAILPNNADLLVTNPLTGDDIEPYLVNTGMYNSRIPWIACVQDGLSNLWSDLRLFATTSVTDESRVSRTTTFLMYAFTAYRSSWYLYSSGSLARNLGYNFHNYFCGPWSSVSGRRLTFDEYFDGLFSWMCKYLRTVNVECITGVSPLSNPNNTPVVTTKQFTVNFTLEPVSNSNNTAINLRQFIYLLQQGYIVSRVSLPDFNWVSLTDMFPVLPDGMYELGFDSNSYNYLRFGPFESRQMDYSLASEPSSISSPLDNVPGCRFVNFSRLVAYQLSCIQFYTTDSVDYLYNCDLWHQNMLALACSVFGSQYLSYSLNGTRHLYDSVSSYLINRVANPLRVFNADYFTFSDDNGIISLNYTASSSAGTGPKAFIYALSYFGNLLGFNRSLKFRDYFVGSKVRPLAVGDVNVQVSSGEFSVVDVTKNIMRQRFLNQVNRVGRSLKEYSRGVFGASPVYDPHEVVFLGSTTDVIGAEETQNTGSEQFSAQAKTSHFRSESSKFAFEGSFQEFGVVVGILTFDVARPYSGNMDRNNFVCDRFEMFNPYMQTIGDQAVYGAEVDANQNLQDFGYQLRYMELRQRVDYCAGGFIGPYLPGFAFVADFRNICDFGDDVLHISPDFIRSRSYEFDDLYQALTNFSPAGYFHFIIRHDCEVQADRPMLAAPTIL